MSTAYISECLSMLPTNSYEVGSPRIAINGRLLGGVHKHSFWSIDLSGKEKLDAEDITFEEFISKTNDSLVEHQEFFKDVRRTGGEIEYFVGWFSNGSINMNIVLDTQLMKSTSDLGISIVLCAYPDHE